MKPRRELSDLEARAYRGSRTQSDRILQSRASGMTYVIALAALRATLS